MALGLFESISIVPDVTKMDQDLNEFDRRLLQAVIEEPAPYESLIEKLSSGMDESSGFRAAEIARYNLFSAISRGLVSACLLHAEAPFITPANVTFETLPRYWFYCTQEGRRALWGTNPASAGIRSGLRASKRDQ